MEKRLTCKTCPPAKKRKTSYGSAILRFVWNVLGKYVKNVFNYLLIGIMIYCHNIIKMGLLMCLLIINADKTVRDLSDRTLMGKVQNY